MADLFQFIDYREYLREWYNQAKVTSPIMSYRFMAKKINIDPGFLVHILQGNKHLSETHIPLLTKFLALNKRETKYFEQLFYFGKARNEAEISRRFKELMELRVLQSRTVASKQYQYYEKWYIPVIRCVIAARGFSGDYAKLAAMIEPEINVDEAKDAVKILLKLGMIEVGARGEYHVLDSFISSGDVWTSLAIQGFQLQTLDLAQRALKTIPKDNREISTLTIAVPSQEMQTLQEMVREFRQKVMRWALEQPDADSVIQCNLQLFPVVKP